MKKILLLVFCFCAAGSLFAQTFKDQYFSSFGFSPYLDFATTPLQVKSPVNNINNDTNDMNKIFVSQESYWGVSLMYEGRYNLTEPSENMAISIKAKPTISISFSTGDEDGGFGGFYVPIGVGLELGNGSTYKTTQNMGFTFTAGYSLNFIPLFGGENPDAVTYGVETSSSWGSPFIAAGVRFWNKKNKLREINVLYGFGGGDDDLPANYDKNKLVGNNNADKFGSSFMLCISWMIFKNY